MTAGQFTHQVAENTTMAGRGSEPDKRVQLSLPKACRRGEAAVASRARSSPAAPISAVPATRSARRPVPVSPGVAPRAGDVPA
jgi:hypothetical protein